MKNTKQTFTECVRAEAASNIDGRKKSDGCLLGLLMLSDYTDDGHIIFKTESEVCKNLLIRLLCHAAECSDCVNESVVRSRGRSPGYILSVESDRHTEKLAERLKIDSFDKSSILVAASKLSEKGFGAFAAGLFLSCGSISSPEKEYHLEFLLPDREICAGIRELLSERLGVSAKITKRNSSDILYLKDSEGIEDVLTLMGATMSSLEIMNVKVLKDIRNRANRATNCDTANCERQNRSAARQLDAIKVIQSSEGGLSLLPDELRQIAEMRLKYPEYTLAELSSEFDPPISKSGANHRLVRLEKIAEDILSGRKENK